MTDRELEEFAAKAAGYSIYWHHADQSHHIEIGGSDRKWRPLKVDDGDALRLAVKLEMNLYVQKGKAIAEICSDSDEPNIVITMLHKDDAIGAMRSAIVHAAAEIGRAM